MDQFKLVAPIFLNEFDDPCSVAYKELSKETQPNFGGDTEDVAKEMLQKQAKQEKQRNKIHKRGRGRLEKKKFKKLMKLLTIKDLSQPLSQQDLQFQRSMLKDNKQDLQFLKNFQDLAEKFQVEVLKIEIPLACLENKIDPDQKERAPKILEYININPGFEIDEYIERSGGAKDSKPTSQVWLTNSVRESSSDFKESESEAKTNKPEIKQKIQEVEYESHSSKASSIRSSQQSHSEEEEQSEEEKKEVEKQQDIIEEFIQQRVNQQEFSLDLQDIHHIIANFKKHQDRNQKVAMQIYFKKWKDNKGIKQYRPNRSTAEGRAYFTQKNKVKIERDKPEVHEVQTKGDPVQDFGHYRPNRQILRFIPNCNSVYVPKQDPKKN